MGMSVLQIAQHARTGEWQLQVQFAGAPHSCQILRRHRLVSGVHR